jgi:hypothetical protein
MLDERRAQNLFMKACYLITALVFLSGSATLGGQQSSSMANLDPALQQALLHDAACHAAPAADGTQLLRVPVKTEEIRVRGREAGVIAAPQDACHCEGENCATYVYLKSGDDYTLALENKFASLHPMNGAMHGLPSLSGKLEVNDSQEETTVYNWDGKEYKASLCATVSRVKNRKLPVIKRHPCGSTLAKKR